MSEAARDQERTAHHRAAHRGGSALPSARDIPVPLPAARADSGPSNRKGRGRGGRRDGPRPSRQNQHDELRPARDMGRPDPSPPAEPAAAVAEIEVEGSAWTVRVLGRSGAVSGRRGAPLLLLGFAPREPGGEGAEREALIVGSTLDALSETELERAFRGARTPPGTGGTRGGKRG